MLGMAFVDNRHQRRNRQRSVPKRNACVLERGMRNHNNSLRSIRSGVLHNRCTMSDRPDMRVRHMQNSVWLFPSG